MPALGLSAAHSRWRIAPANLRGWVLPLLLLALLEVLVRLDVLAAHQMLARLNGRELSPPPAATMCGALLDYITTPNKDFQPMGANMGILPRTEEINSIRDKRERYMALSQAAQDAMQAWVKEYEA